MSYAFFRKIKKLFINPDLYFRDYFDKRIRTKNSGNVETKKGVLKQDNVAKPSSKATPVKSKFDQSILFSNCYLDGSINKNKKNYLYIPWIELHSNVLISSIDSDSLNFIPFRLFRNLADRRPTGKFARENPIEYKKIIASKLLEIKDEIDGLIVTLDWSQPMRLAVLAAKELKIPTILIPHESIFLNESKYYWDENTNASCPVCDYCLAWGDLQKRIFCSRGYDKNRVLVVGSPKLDQDVLYKQKLNRKQYCDLMGLDENRPIILFATQYLDSQVNFDFAMAKQAKAILDIIQYCEERDKQLVIRMPPNGVEIFDKATIQKIKTSERVAVDGKSYYLTNPREAIKNADVVISINSTMLFEARLMGKPSIATKYFSVKSIWRDNLIPAAKNKDQLYVLLDSVLSEDLPVCEEEMSRLAREFGVGKFDGQSGTRIVNFLLNEKLEENKEISVIDKIINNKKFDVVAIPSNTETLQTTQKYIKSLLNANYVLGKAECDNGKSMMRLGAVECFFQWGIAESQSKIRFREAAKKFNKPVVFIEDGFLRSVDIGLSGEAGMSILLDDLTAYYDATKKSRMEQILNSELKISTEDLANARKNINLIVSNKVSKYNHSPIVKLDIGREGKRKILLIDQRFGDMSVEKGLGSEKTFDKMLQDALARGKEYDIIIKQHPDAIKGGKGSYFNKEKLTFTKDIKNIYIVDYDVNPYSLLELVDEVFVCTSGMGFEALMAGKKVTCYGAPFYSNWGITTDKVLVPRRQKKRSLEEIFFVSYMLLSKYVSPITGERCDIKDIIEYIIKVRQDVACN